MRNYPLFLEEVARVLRPGGLVILIENEIKPITEGKVAIEAGPRGGAPGWHAFWEQYRRCLTGNGIDTTVPTRLPGLLAATGAFDDIVAQEATIPVGFWPKGAWRTHFFHLPIRALSFRLEVSRSKHKRQTVNFGGGVGNE